MQPSTKPLKCAGYMMLVAGVILILFNAANYVFSLDIETTSTPSGLLMLAAGSIFLRRANEGNKYQNEKESCNRACRSK